MYNLVNSNAQPMGLRTIKILFAFITAVYMGLVTFNNITDYQSNFSFVRGVFSMKELSSGEVNSWRSVTEPFLHHAAYLLIIGMELSISVFLSLGAYRMFKVRGGDVNKFHSAGKFVSAGLALGVVLWFGIFLAIGGEWFLMWQSPKWNGQVTAFPLSIIFLLFLVVQQRHDR